MARSATRTRGRRKSSRRGVRRNAGFRKRWAKFGRKSFSKRTKKKASGYKMARRAAHMNRGHGKSWAKYGRKVGRKRGHRWTTKTARSAALKSWGKNSGSASVLGFRVPMLGSVARPFSVSNAKQAGGLALGAAAAVAGTAFAAGYLPEWNSGYWGVGLTSLVSGGAYALAASFLPAFAPMVGLGGLIVSGLRAAIQFVPTIVGHIVTPLLEWTPAAAAAAAPASGTQQGFRALPRGRVAGFLSESPMRDVTDVAGEQFHTSKNVF